MGHHQRRSTVDDALHRHLQILWIERSKAFVKDDEIGALQQRTLDVQSASLTVRKLPPGFAHHLHMSAAYYALQQISQNQLVKSDLLVCQ